MTNRAFAATLSGRTARWSTRRTPAATPMTVLGLLMPVLLALSACGSADTADTNSDDDAPAAATEDDSSGGGSSATSDEQAMLDFYQCLRDNGLDVQDPGQGGSMTLPEQVDTDDPDVQAIIEECAGSTDGSGRVSVGGQMGENLAGTDALVAFVDCMRENGIDMPDPAPDGRLSMPENVDPNSTGFQQATQACTQYLDGGGILMGDGEGGGVTSRGGN